MISYFLNIDYSRRPFLYPNADSALIIGLLSEKDGKVKKSTSKSRPSSEEPNYEQLLGADPGSQNNQSTIRFDAGSDSRSGIGTVVATALLISSIAASIILGIITTSSSGSTSATWDRNIRVSVTIATSLFSQASDDSICSHNDIYGNLSGAVVSIVDASGASLGRRNLGGGTLNQVGGCKYDVKLAAPPSFTGGKIYTTLTFPFGPYKASAFDVGNTQPFQQQSIDITLDQK